jgi:protein TonB
VPAYAERKQLARPRERIQALAAVVVVQGAIAFALLTGLKGDFRHPVDSVQRLVEITLAKPPSPEPQPIEQPEPAKRPESAAPKTAPAKPGASPGPKPAHAPPSVTPVVAVKPTAAPSGGGTGSGPAAGAGTGGGTGGDGYGGVPELDALTCRLIMQRFRYRPSTDRYGRPIPDTVDGEHEWIPHR